LKPLVSKEPKTVVLCLGCYDAGPLGQGIVSNTVPLQANEGAYIIAEAFQRLQQFNIRTMVSTWDTRSSGSLSRIVGAIHNARNLLQPGDSFAMYVNGHAESLRDPANQNELPIDFFGGSSWTMNSGDEALAISPGSLISDDQLTAIFSQDGWPEIQKLLIFDTCHAEGFWTASPADEGDLQRVPRTAFIGACPEGYVAEAVPDPLHGGILWGKLGMALEAALGISNNDSPLHFMTLAARIQSWDSVVRGEDGYLLDFGGGYGQRTTALPWNPVFASSTNSSFVLTSTAPRLRIRLGAQGEALLSVEGPAETAYTVETRPGLTSINGWRTLIRGMTPNSQIALTNLANPGSSGFYRALLE